MKLAKQRRQNNAARARNARGKKRSKGKRPPGENGNSFEGGVDVNELMEDSSQQSSLGKIHTKVQREMDDKAEAPVQKKEDTEVMKKEDETAVSKKEEIQPKEKETVSPKEEKTDVSMKEEIQPATEKEPAAPAVQTKAMAGGPKYNMAYFTLEGETGSQAMYVKETVSAYDAVHDVIENRHLYSLDVGSLRTVAALCVKAKEMGKEKFDMDYALKNPVCIKLAN